MSDTSPIRALGFLNLLGLLPQLFDQVLITPTVADELRRPRGQLAAVDVCDLPFLTLAAPRDADRQRELSREVDPAEAEAMTLALERHAGILIDEKRGRRVASRLGLTVIGTLAILEQSKRAGLLPEIRPLIGRLVAELNFFLDPQLVATVLSRAGESQESGEQKK